MKNAHLLLLVSIVTEAITVHAAAPRRGSITHRRTGVSYAAATLIGEALTQTKASSAPSTRIQQPPIASSCSSSTSRSTSRTSSPFPAKKASIPPAPSTPPTMIIPAKIAATLVTAISPRFSAPSTPPALIMPSSSLASISSRATSPSPESWLGVKAPSSPTTAVGEEYTFVDYADFKGLTILKSESAPNGAPLKSASLFTRMFGF